MKHIMKRRNFIAMLAAAPLCKADDRFYKYFSPLYQKDWKTISTIHIFFDEEVTAKILGGTSVGKTPPEGRIPDPVFNEVWGPMMQINKRTGTVSSPRLNWLTGETSWYENKVPRR